MKTELRAPRPRSVYIEYLEKRIAPATFVVTNLNDAGTGSLRDAVEQANDRPGADKIVFRGDATGGEIALIGGVIAITDSVKIKGPGAGELIINAQNLSRIFSIDDGTATVKKVTISGLSMVEGNSGTGSGGAIRTLESLTLVNSVISGSEANAPQADGGGLYSATAGTLVIRNSKITGNTAGDVGGGVSVAYGGVQVINSVISGNTAGTRGGGIFAYIGPTDTGNILISGSDIVQNTAGTFAGGISAQNMRTDGGNTVGKITIRDTIVSGNTAIIAGGGINLPGGHALIERSVINNNMTEDAGGGLSAFYLESLTIKNSTVASNRSTSTGTSGGGGVFIFETGKVLIQGSVVSGNTSAAVGGGLALVGSRTTIQNSTISGNSTGENGGGIYAFQSLLRIDRSSLRDNQAANSGGGVHTRGDGDFQTDVQLIRSLFTGNRALDGSGGAMDTVGDGAVTIDRSRFISNTAGNDGGALSLYSTDRITIVSSLISRNAAADGGGGVELSGPGIKVVRSTSILSNVAGDDGGGIRFIDGTLSLNAATRILDNVATAVGGGIANLTASAVALNRAKVTGNTATVGPQISGPFTP